MMELACLVNGEISAFVQVGDRGLAYGDGLFETLVVSSGRPRFWQAHMDRLSRGCEVLDLSMPAQELLLREVLTVAAGCRECVVKIVLTRGAAGRGYAPPKHSVPTRVVAAYPMPEGLEDQRRRGVRARTCAIRLALQPALGGIKHLNRLEQVLAAREMHAHPEMEGLLLNQEGYVTGAISANIFLVCADALLTPRMDRSGIRGVARSLILRDFKHRAELRRVSPDMLEEADELFLCNAVRGIVPLVAVDGRSWPVGPKTRELQEWFTRRCAAA